MIDRLCEEKDSLQPGMGTPDATIIAGSRSGFRLSKSLPDAQTVAISNSAVPEAGQRSGVSVKRKSRSRAAGFLSQRRYPQ